MNIPVNYTNKTLEELENDDWGEPTYPSYLVTTCHKLRKKPLKDFGTEDLRIMIGQSIGLIYLIPLAIEVLKNDLFASGNFYEGDLLTNVLKVKKEYWIENKTHYDMVSDLIKNKLADLDELKIGHNDFLRLEFK